MEISKNAKPNIVLTGGHAATTAYAVVQEIQRQKKDWNIYWLGSKYSVEGAKFTTLEFNILPSLGVKFVPIIPSRIQRTLTIYTIPSLLKFPLAFLQAFYNIHKLKPKLVLSFGGFSSFPVVVAAKIMAVPVILHEQTSLAGRASIASAKFVDKIAISRPSSERFFSKEKILLTGNPISKNVLSVAIKEKLGKPPVVFVTGGSRGSQRINEVVEKLLPTLLKKYIVFHQTGEKDESKFMRLKDSFSSKYGDNYHVFPFLDPLQISNIYQKSDIIISRSGANTVSELGAIKRPCVLIPLPISYKDEQLENAKFLQRLGLAQIILQDKLNEQTLLNKIRLIESKYSQIVKQVKKWESPDATASTKLVSIISEYIK